MNKVTPQETKQEILRCSVCGKIITDPQEKEFTQATGMCFRCDHVYAEVLDERRPADVDY